MPKLSDVMSRTAENFLRRLSRLHESFSDDPNECVDVIRELNDFWPQIEASQRWASENALTSERAADIAERFTVYCADNGDQLIEIHRPTATRIDWLESGLRAAQHYKHEIASAKIEYNLGVIKVALSMFEVGRQHIESARAVFERFEMTPEFIAAHNALALVAAQTGDEKAAAKLHGRARSLSIKHELPYEEAVSTHQLSRSLRRLGHRSESRELLQVAQEKFEAMGRHKNAIDISLDLGRDALNIGDSELAFQCCDDAYRSTIEHQLPVDGNVLQHRVAALMLDVEHPQTTTFVEETLAEAARLNNHMMEGCMLQLQSVLAYKASDFELAIGRCDRSIDAFAKIGAEYGVEAGRTLRQRLDEVVELNAKLQSAPPRPN